MANGLRFNMCKKLRVEYREVYARINYLGGVELERHDGETPRDTAYNWQRKQNRNRKFSRIEILKVNGELV